MVVRVAQKVSDIKLLCPDSRVPCWLEAAHDVANIALTVTRNKGVFNTSPFGWGYGKVLRSHQYGATVNPARTALWRSWTRPNPFEADWSRIDGPLQTSPGIEAKTLFGALQERAPWAGGAPPGATTVFCSSRRSGRGRERCSG